MSIDIPRACSRLLMSLLLALTLAACGGSGSGGASNSDGDEGRPTIDPAPTPPDDPAEPLDYTGSESRATISSTNAAELLYAALKHQLTRIAAISIETSHSVVQSDTSSGASLYRRPRCSDGDVGLTSELNQLYEGYSMLEFDGCAIGDATLDGRITITIDDLPSGRKIAASSIVFDRLTVAGSDGTFMYSGKIEYGSRFSLKMEAVVENTDNGEQYRFSDYTENTQYNLGAADPTYTKAVSGRVYHSEFGYFDVQGESSVHGYIDSSEILQSRVVLLGRNGSQLTGTGWARGGGLIELNVDGDPEPEHSAFVGTDVLLLPDNGNIADTDGDGLHDSWERANGYDPQVDDNDSGDSDGDGIRDVDEQRLGTSPTDGDSYPEVVDLSVALTDSGDPTAIENPYTYTIDMTNHGTVNTETASAVLSLPSGVTVNDMESWCSAEGGLVTCNVYLLEPGETRSYEIEVIAPSTVSLLEASVDVTDELPEPNQRNNADTETTQLQLPVADVAVSLSRRFIRMRAGGPASGSYYGDVDIYLDSLGPDAALDTQISFSVPPELNLEIVEVSGGDCTGGPDYVCNVRDEPSDSRFTNFGRISLDFESDAPGIYPMPITLSHDGTDPDPENNTVTLSSFVGVSLPDSVWDGIDVAAPGDTVSVPAGYYYLGSAFRYDANINLTSESGPDNTFISMSGLGISPGNGGRISDITFTHSLGSIKLVEADFTLSGNVFRGNGQPQNGFAAPELIHISDHSNITLEKNRFEDNFCMQNSEPLNLIYIEGVIGFNANNNVFSNNECKAVVVGNISLVDAVIVNNTWADNHTALELPYEFMDSGTAIHNNLFYGHTYAVDTLTDCGASCDTLKSNLLYGNEHDYAGSQDQTGVNGNISDDPLFTDPADGDYSLQTGSPAIDAGNPARVPEDDFDGNTRDADPDIGAYEYQ